MPVVFVINGVMGIPEYDPFGNVIRYHHPEFRPVRGENVLELWVPDRAGNVTEMRFTVRH